MDTKENQYGIEMDEDKSHEPLSEKSPTQETRPENYLDSIDEITDPNIKLYKVCREGNVRSLKQILKDYENVLDINAKYENGSTCLHEVTIHNCQYAEMVKILLEHGASVNFQDDDGNTPLHTAVLFHCVENIKEIMNYNPNISLKNQDGATAVDFAKNIEDTELESLLTGTEVKERKRKLRQGSQISRSVNRKIKSFLPVTPITSPSILKKRKLIKEVESSSPLTKRFCVKFDLPSENSIVSPSTS